MSKQTMSANGEACTLRLDKCNGFETVVFAHKNGAGMGQKSVDDKGNDIGFFACQYCHDVYDGRIQHKYYTQGSVDNMVERFAIPQTQTKLQLKGLWHYV